MSQITLSSLPPQKNRWGAFTTAFVIQGSLLVLLALLPPTQAQRIVHNSQLLFFPNTPEPQPEPQPEPRPVRVVRPQVPKVQERQMVEAKVEKPVFKTVEIQAPPPPPQHPHVMPVNFQPIAVAPVAPPPPKLVQTNVFGGSSAKLPTVNKPAREVQTGGFGDPEGLKANALGGSRGNVAHVGSFDLPSGPGMGNGTGGARGVAGRVRSVGFGNGIASGVPSGARGSVQTAGFGDGRATAGAPVHRHVIASPMATPVEIISKPRPAYTDEARQLKIEGEVLLKVIFTASGEVNVLGIERGLGHGLDESAVRCAQHIRFRPARNADGQPMDSTATVHIMFELAY